MSSIKLFGRTKTAAENLDLRQNPIMLSNYQDVSTETTNEMDMTAEVSKVINDKSQILSSCIEDDSEKQNGFSQESQMTTKRLDEKRDLLPRISRKNSEWIMKKHFHRS